ARSYFMTTSSHRARHLVLYPPLLPRDSQSTYASTLAPLPLSHLCRLPLHHHQSLNHYVDLGVEFRYFFVRKNMFVKYAEGFVVFPGGFGALDESFEALTLTQTGKIQHFPIVLFDRSYWAPLVDWLHGPVLEGGKVSFEDLDLFLLADEPAEVVQHIQDVLDRRRAGEEPT